MRPLRRLFALLTLLALATALAACGGGGGGGSEDPQTVLDKTFSPDQKLESADLDASLDVKVEGTGAGEFNASLSGPIDGHGSGFPKFDLTAKLSGDAGGQNVDFEGGVTSTGDAGFVNYKGTDYAVPQSIFSLLTSAYQSGQQQQNQQQSQTLPQLKKALTNLSNEGTTDVEGTQTTHISGDLDVGKFIDLVRGYVQQAQALGQLGAGAQLPSPQQLDQLRQLVSGATFDVYSGTDDNILRRLDFTLELQEPGGSGKATFTVDVTLGSVNEPQTIEAPGNPKPLRDLLQQLGVGNLGALGLGTGAGGGGASSGGGSSQSSGSAAIQCIEKATTPAELQKCGK